MSWYGGWAMAAASCVLATSACSSPGGELAPSEVEPSGDEPTASAEPEPPPKASEGSAGTHPSASSSSDATGEAVELGLGSIGTLSSPPHGFSGTPSNATKAIPQVRLDASVVSGELPRELVQRIVRQNFGRFRLCYENALRDDAGLLGGVRVHFVITRQGSVSPVSGVGSIPDPKVISCVVKAFRGLTFPMPKSDVVKVDFPIRFMPAADLELGGEPVERATLASFRAAATAAGLTITGETPKGKGVQYTAQRGQDRFTIVVLTADAGEEGLPAEERKRLLSVSAVYEKDSFWLSIEHAQPLKAGELLNRLLEPAP